MAAWAEPRMILNIRKDPVKHLELLVDLGQRKRASYPRYAARTRSFLRKSAGGPSIAIFPRSITYA